MGSWSPFWVVDPRVDYRGQLLVTILMVQTLCEFSTVRADRAVFGSSENFCNFAKVSYFSGCVFHVFVGKNSTKKVFLHLAALKFDKHKSEKRSILAVKCTCKNEKKRFSILDTNLWHCIM